MNWKSSSLRVRVVERMKIGAIKRIFILEEVVCNYQTALEENAGLRKKQKLKMKYIFFPQNY